MENKTLNTMQKYFNDEVSQVVQLTKETNRKGKNVKENPDRCLRYSQECCDSERLGV